tara:strand:- start:89 stop:1813 length:1725 start_codon:yes stop_codon:yes gene_type:complete
MNRVKELREEKIKRKKIADEIEEQIREELRNLNSPEFSNWRWDLDEGMTSSGLFQTTLPATGDVDLSITSMDASSFSSVEDVSFDSGTNSGFTGGFSADGGVMNFSGDVNYNTAAGTNALDLSKVDTVSISAIAGNNSNGGMLPSNDLVAAFIDSDFNVSDDFTVISKTSNSFSNTNINIPQEFRKSGVTVLLYSTTGVFADQGQHLKPFTISISGLNHATMGSIGSGAGGSTGVNNIVAGILQKDATTANYRSMGVVLWDNIQMAKNGFSQGNNPNYGQPGETQFISLNNWDPAPVSGNRNQYGSAPDANGNDVDGVTDADYIYIGQHMFDTYKNSKLYGVSNISFKRKTPMNVFVSLDSPEATNFIRTDPIMQGLSAEGRKKKLLDMLEAGDEYLLKHLGMTGSTARPSETTMPNSWEQAGGYGAGGPNPYGTPGAEKPYTRRGYKDKDGKFVDYDNPSTWPSILKKASNNQKTVVAHHEPQGKVLSEKKKLKSVKDITSKIPGYYDGKPAPLGFPMQEPPKMVNGFHPDLVDGKKIANRFNRLDPASAKAMPPTGNPHIDKKVRAAAKKPK